MMEDGKCKMKNGLKLSHLTSYLFHFTFLILLSSCSSAQEDKILYKDSVLHINVYQSDLNNYLKLKAQTDTAGKTKGYLKIICSAKFMSATGPNIIRIIKPLTYEQALIIAEENARLRSLVNKVVVVKHERKMYLLKDGKTVKTFNVALGPNPVGQKEYEGDGKTPEGIYTLDWQKWNSSTLHSFHISYPNKLDSARAKTKGLIPGSNIMVHGTSKGIKKKKDWTNGCIALTNEDMLTFRKIVFQDTQIEITK
jgi:L,D-peptidoglycan transpeptidase YkuD (ErfK/YbiS/YcfS/YnhG family)